jgi:hypothetical protein
MNHRSQACEILYKGKVKVKLSLHFNWPPCREDILGSGGIALHVLDIGTWWRWVVSSMARPIYPQGKSPLYPLDRRLGWAPEPVWAGWWGEKIPASIETRIPNHPARRPLLYHWAIPASWNITWRYIINIPKNSWHIFFCVNNDKHGDSAKLWGCIWPI